MIAKKEPQKLVSYIFEEYKSSINDEVVSLNAGGCGIFAEHLYKLLEAIGFEPKLVVLTDDVEKMELRIKDEVEYRWAALIVHIMVELDGKYLDSEGVYHELPKRWTNCSKFKGTTKKLDIKQLSKWNKITLIWNTCFNRRKYIPKIKKEFKKINEKVVKEFA